MATHGFSLLSATLLGVSLLLVGGCAQDGDDGKDGTAGATGAVGATGATGATGAAGAAGTDGDDGLPASAGVNLRFLGRYTHLNSGGTPVFDQGAAEITAYDSASKRLVVVNAVRGGVDVLNATDPTALTLVQFVDVAALVEVAQSLTDGTLGGVNSVAIHNGVAAVAVEAATKTDNGYIAFINVATLTLVGSVAVGALPDMVTFSPNGSYILVANEGEPANNYTINPAGTVSVINVTAGYGSATVASAGFTAWDVGGTRNGEVAALQAAGLRFNTITGASATFSQDIEPEYITVAADNATAYVTLQENNAIAVVDLATATVTSIFGLGYKDHGIPGNELDASDRDVDGSSGSGGLINIRTWPGVFGAFMPDAIASYKVGGATYLVTANEGDARDYGNASFEDTTTVGTLVGTIGALTGRLAGQDTADRLSRLTVLKDVSTTSRLVTMGARSITIWDAASGARVWDSGSEMERQIANRLPAYFNVSSTNNTLDNRSDDKGPEPEGIALGTVGTSTYAFVGLERIGGVMVWDITNPQAPRFVSYRNDRNFSQTPAAGAGGDLAPEGLLFVPAATSPSGEALLVVGNETSGTTVIYRVADLISADG